MIKKDGFYGAPDLVIEILSPDTVQYDRGVKRQVYEKEGVLEYYVPDPNDLTVNGYSLQNNYFIPIAQTQGHIASPFIGWQISF